MSEEKIERRKGEKLHRTINWTTLIGVISTAVLGYIANDQRGEADEKLATGAALEIAAIQEWQGEAKLQLATQAEQITRLREAVAAMGARSGQSSRVRAAVEELQQEPNAPLPEPRPLDHAYDLKQKLLGD